MQVKAPWTGCLSSCCFGLLICKIQVILSFSVCFSIHLYAFFFPSKKRINKNSSLDPHPFQLLSWSQFSWYKHHQRISFFVCFFIFGCMGSYVAAWGFSCSAWASHCGSFSCCDLWALGHGLNCCGPRAYLPCSMWNLPAPGMEPVSPALADGFLNTGPPGTSDQLISI